MADSPSFLPDIHSEEDIERLVDTFYRRVQADELLGPIFEAVVQGRWPQHLATMYDFWSGLLLNTGRYRGRPFPKHLALPVDGSHFQQWLKLFVENVEAQYQGPVADEAIYRAGTIAAVFEHRISQARNPYHIL